MAEITQTNNLPYTFLKGEWLMTGIEEQHGREWLPIEGENHVKRIWTFSDKRLLTISSSVPWIRRIEALYFYSETYRIIFLNGFSFDSNGERHAVVSEVYFPEAVSRDELYLYDTEDLDDPCKLPKRIHLMRFSQQSAVNSKQLKN